MREDILNKNIESLIISFSKLTKEFDNVYFIWLVKILIPVIKNYLLSKIIKFMKK